MVFCVNLANVIGFDLSVHMQKLLTVRGRNFFIVLRPSIKGPKMSTNLIPSLVVTRPHIDWFMHVVGIHRAIHTHRFGFTSYLLRYINIEILPVLSLLSANGKVNTFYNIFKFLKNRNCLPLKQFVWAIIPTDTVSCARL